MIAPTTSTQVFYISVSVCCIVIFLVAIFLAIMHLHSMKRMEMGERFVSLVPLPKAFLSSGSGCTRAILGLTSDPVRWRSTLLCVDDDVMKAVVDFWVVGQRNLKFFCFFLFVTQHE